jgi:hypothetical protein
MGQCSSCCSDCSPCCRESEEQTQPPEPGSAGLGPDLLRPLFPPGADFEEFKIGSPLFEGQQYPRYSNEELKEEFVADAAEFVDHDNESIRHFFEDIADIDTRKKVSTYMLSIERFIAEFSVERDYIWANVGKALASDGGISLEAFRSFVATTARTQPHHGIELLWDASQGNDTLTNKEKTAALLLTLLEVSGCDRRREGTERTRDELAACLWRHLRVTKKETTDNLTFSLFLQWVDLKIPCISDALHSFIKEKIFTNSAYESSYHPVSLNQENYIQGKRLSSGNNRSSCSIIEQSDVIPLALHCVGAQGVWRRLYSSAVHGKSLLSLGKCILGYNVSHHKRRIFLLI